jgi:Zn-dependent protease
MTADTATLRTAAGEGTTPSVKAALSKLAKIGILLAPVAKYLTLLLKIKGFALVASMLASIAAYTLYFGWTFAVGLVALLAVHELGHMVAFRRMGIRTSLPMFVPLVGAFIAVKDKPKTVLQEAYGAIGGPAVGALPAFALWGLALAYDSSFLLALAFVGMVLNLSNLIPMLPLDGGRIVAAIHPGLWAVGLLGLAVLEVLHPSGIVLMILILGTLELKDRALNARRWTRLDDPKWIARTTRRRTRKIDKQIAEFVAENQQDWQQAGDSAERIERRVSARRSSLVDDARTRQEVLVDRDVNRLLYQSYPFEDDNWWSQPDAMTARDSARQKLRPAALQYLREKELDYMRVAKTDRARIAAGYLLLIALLGWGAVETYVPRALNF